MRTSSKFWLGLSGVLVICSAWYFYSPTPRAWAVTEVPVAFWAWRLQTPTEADLQQAISEARARAIFLHAGQFDGEGGTPRRVRAVAGRFPRAVELHLVYNGTRSLLTEFERLDTAALASVIVETYAQDVARASSDGARVAGLQLDFDVPTRLLPRYRQLLRATRELLPLVPQGRELSLTETKLSVTGLPTWMDAPEISGVLAAVDFWVPQFYGATIPDRLDQLTPITSPQVVARGVARARQLNRPFYAGLPAYGYAILYSPGGALIALRGDLDPARVASHPNFELIERRAFASPASSPTAQSPIASEWRYVYRALGDGVIDDLAVRAGDLLMADVASAEALRVCTRMVRERAGQALLGVCIFRLPGADDPTTLTIGEVAVALADQSPVITADVRIERVGRHEGQEPAEYLLLKVTNNGAASALMGDGALAIDLRVPAGSINGVRSLTGFTSFETLCELPGVRDAGGQGEWRPCGPRRANLVRLKSRSWAPGAKMQVALSTNGPLPQTVPIAVTVQVNDGRRWQKESTVTVAEGGEP